MTAPGSPKPAVNNRFQKGNRINPAGRPKLTEEQKTIRRYNKLELEAAISKYLHMSVQILRRRIKQRVTGLDYCVIAAILKAGDTGNITNLEWMSNRLFGAPPRPPTIQVQTQVNNLPQGQSVQAQIEYKDKLLLENEFLTAEQLEMLEQKAKLIEGETETVDISDLDTEVTD